MVVVSPKYAFFVFSLYITCFEYNVKSETEISKVPRESDRAIQNPSPKELEQLLSEFLRRQLNISDESTISGSSLGKPVATKECLKSGEECPPHSLCVDPGDGSVKCKCKKGFIRYKSDDGKLICIDINECEYENICPPHAHCKNTMGSHECVCDKGYQKIGQKCIVKPEGCALSPCRNGGSCVPSQLHGYQCKCRLGFTGPHCEMELTECEAYPCSNGGVCISTETGYVCQCDPGFTGTWCEVATAKNGAAETQEKLQLAAVIIGVFVGILVITLVALIICWRKGKTNINRNRGWMGHGFRDVLKKTKKVVPAGKRGRPKYFAFKSSKKAKNTEETAALINNKYHQENETGQKKKNEKYLKVQEKEEVQSTTENEESTTENEEEHSTTTENEEEQVTVTSGVANQKK